MSSEQELLIPLHASQPCRLLAPAAMGVSAGDVEARLRSELAATDVQVQDIAGCVAARSPAGIAAKPGLRTGTRHIDSRACTRQPPPALPNHGQVEQCGHHFQAHSMPARAQVRHQL